MRGPVCWNAEPKVQLFKKYSKGQVWTQENIMYELNRFFPELVADSLLALTPFQFGIWPFLKFLSSNSGTDLNPLQKYI